MTGNDLDSGQTAGTEVSPNTAGSQGTGDSSGSFDAAKLQTTLEAITARLEEVDARSRSLQGEKDRGVTQTRKEIADLKRQFAEIEKLKSSGMETDQAVEEFDFRETVRQLKDQIGKLNPASPQTAGNGASGVANVAQVFETLGLDPKDPRVAVALTKRYENPDQVELAAYRLARELAQSPNPTLAQSASLQGGNAQSAGNLDALDAEMQALYKNPTAPGAVQRMTEIGEIMKKAG